MTDANQDTDHAGFANDDAAWSTFDIAGMRLALAAASAVRTTTAPNPWVGAAVVGRDGSVLGTGATEPAGGRHAEVLALAAAGASSAGATLFATLEPCSHQGRTPPCTDAIVRHGIERVVVGVVDPDPRVAGRGIDALRSVGITVDVGVEGAAVATQLRSYLHHRSTGRPFVYCKVAASLDGGTAAADGSSRWITSAASRADGHRLRAESGAILVGAGTVRADDPSLTVRHVEGPDPQRIVLGSAPIGARVHPCLEWHGSLDELLDRLGEQGVLQLLVEGGATVIRSFLDAGLVDAMVIYVAPALFGGANAHPFIGGPTSVSMSELRRGRFIGVEQCGDDLRIEFEPFDQHHSHHNNNER